MESQSIKQAGLQRGQGDSDARATVRISEIISALSFALDLTEGRPMGHSVRTCMIGMRIAAEIGLSVPEQSDLYYALLLKDAGCSSNSSKLFHILSADEIRAKRDVKLYVVDADLKKAQVGISSIWYSGNPCNMHLLDLSNLVKQSVQKSGESADPMRGHGR